MLSAIVVVVEDPSKVVIAVVDVVLAVDIVENFVGVVAPLVVPVVSSFVVSVVTPVVTPVPVIFGRIVQPQIPSQSPVDAGLPLSLNSHVFTRRNFKPTSSDVI